MAGRLQQHFLELMNATLADNSSYNIIPSLRNETPLMRHSAQKTYKVYGTSNCRIARQLFRSLTKPQRNEQSTCPWYVYLDYDSERIPQIIAKARCTCTMCIGVMDSSNNGPGRCEPVDSFRTVLRRCKNDSDCVYYVDVEAVPVGCSCNRVVNNRTNSNAPPALSHIDNVIHTNIVPPP